LNAVTGTNTGLARNPMGTGSSTKDRIATAIVWALLLSMPYWMAMIGGYT
jgi:hypothetical protein